LGDVHLIGQGHAGLEQVADVESGGGALEWPDLERDREKGVIDLGQAGGEAPAAALSLGLGQQPVHIVIDPRVDADDLRGRVVIALETGGAIRVPLDDVQQATLGLEAEAFITTDDKRVGAGGGSRIERPGGAVGAGIGPGPIRAGREVLGLRHQGLVDVGLATAGQGLHLNAQLRAPEGAEPLQVGEGEEDARVGEADALNYLLHIGEG